MKVLLVAIALLMTLAAIGEAHGQLFRSGPRDRRLSRDSRRGTTGEVGSVRGDERFVRGSRRRTDFVGTDVREREAFVGSQQAESSGRVRPATSNLRVRETRSANRQLQSATRQPAKMYDPRLTVGFDFTVPSSEQIGSDLARRLEAAPNLRLLGPIEVSVHRETATLSGEVASERDRTLAGLLMLFEPGISAVENNLRVAAADDNPPAGHRGRPGSRK